MQIQRPFLVVCVFVFSIVSNHIQAQDRVFVCAGPKLFSVDAENCIADLKGSTMTFWDIAFTSDGRLWGIEPHGGIYQIDTSNADTTFMFDTDLYSSSLEGLDDNNLLAISEQWLYRINLITANTQSLGQIGYTPSGDIAWYDDHLYLNANSIARIDLDTASLTVNEVEHVSWWASDGLDGYGLAVADFFDSTKVMVVFDKYDMYTVCQLDGSTRLRCPTLLNQWANGAAHLRHPTQDPQPEICHHVIEPTEELQYFINHLNNVITVYSSKEFANLSVSLFNVSGQRIRNYSELNGTEFSFNVGELAFGVYIIRIDDGTNIQSEKIVLR